MNITLTHRTLYATFLPLVRVDNFFNFFVNILHSWGKPKCVNLFLVIVWFAFRCKNCYPTHCVRLWHDSNFMRYIYRSKKIIITPCDTANALGGTIFHRNVINSATNGSGGGTGEFCLFVFISQFLNLLWYHNCTIFILQWIEKNVFLKIIFLKYPFCSMF